MIQLTGESNDSLHLTGWSLPLIENLNDDADDFRQVNSSVRLLRIREKFMPSLEIICIDQQEPTDFPNLPFRVKAENVLVSHRRPDPLFQSDFNRLQGCIYHVLDKNSLTCYDLLVRDWHDEQGNPNDFDEKVEFREEYAEAMKQVLEQLLDSSPIGQILFTTDYQFGPMEAQRHGPLSFTIFKELYNAGKVRMNAAYLISAI